MGILRCWTPEYSGHTIERTSSHSAKSSYGLMLPQEAVMSTNMGGGFERGFVKFTEELIRLSMAMNSDAYGLHPLLEAIRFWIPAAENRRRVRLVLCSSPAGWLLWEQAAGSSYILKLKHIKQMSCKMHVLLPYNLYISDVPQYSILPLFYHISSWNVLLKSLS